MRASWSRAVGEQPGRLLLLPLAGIFLYSLAGDREIRGPVILVAAGSVLLLGTGVWSAYAYSGARQSRGLAAVALATFSLTWIAPHSAAPALAYVAIGLVGRSLPLRAGATAAVAVAGVTLLEIQLRGAVPDRSSLLLMSLTMAVTYLGTYTASRGREQRLIAARLEERERLAREIHDVLAHSLSALSVQLELAKVQVDAGTSAAASATLDRASRLTRQGLEETRRAVAALRGEGVASLGELPRLVEEFRSDTGVECVLAVDSDLPTLSTEEGAALYRVAQEALTNARRHSSARRVALRVAREGRGVELTVENDGGSRLRPGGGYGLLGMRERAELLGGRLDAAPTEQGFRVRLWLPA